MAALTVLASVCETEVIDTEQIIIPWLFVVIACDVKRQLMENTSIFLISVFLQAKLAPIQFLSG